MVTPEAEVLVLRYLLSDHNIRTSITKSNSGDTWIKPVLIAGVCRHLQKSIKLLERRLGQDEHTTITSTINKNSPYNRSDNITCEFPDTQYTRGSTNKLQKYNVDIPEGFPPGMDPFSSSIPILSSDTGNGKSDDITVSSLNINMINSININSYTKSESESESHSTKVEETNNSTPKTSSLTSCFEESIDDSTQKIDDSAVLDRVLDNVLENETERGILNSQSLSPVSMEKLVLTLLNRGLCDKTSASAISKFIVLSMTKGIIHIKQTSHSMNVLAERVSDIIDTINRDASDFFPRIIIDYIAEGRSTMDAMPLLIALLPPRVQYDTKNSIGSTRDKDFSMLYAVLRLLNLANMRFEALALLRELQDRVPVYVFGRMLSVIQ